MAIGENIQASILTTLILKELGVNTITVKAQNDYHEKVLAKIGADHIVHPERDMAKRIAHNIVSNNVLDYLELSDEHSIVEIVTAGLRATHCLIWTSGRSTALISWYQERKEVIVSPLATEMIQKKIFSSLSALLRTFPDLKKSASYKVKSRP